MQAACRHFLRNNGLFAVDGWRRQQAMTMVTVTLARVYCRTFHKVPLTTERPLLVVQSAWLHTTGQTAFKASRKKMPPKKGAEEKLMLGRPSNNLKIGVVGLPNVG
jgi:hypothetical protein